MRRYLVACLLVVGLLAGARPTFAQDDNQVGKISFSGGSVAAGIGFTWGSGTLTFQGKSYPFSVNGLSVVDVGIASIQGEGTVYNLKNPSDFAGNYVAAGAGATIAGGGTVAALQNQNGVVIHFHSTTTGLKLNLSASGISIALK
jgi:hypothetical protein